MTTTRHVYTLATAAVLLAGAAGAEEWTRARIARLPDSAFAVVEAGPDGRTVRHLPHHDETGALDLAHLRAGRGRLAQVRWLDPANATIARQHLDEHWRAIAPRRLPPR
jgi:hypothetical protein